MAMDLHKELLTLRRDILNMGAEVEQRVRNVVEALESGDTELAREVKKGDREIDEIELHIESECLRILALGGPVASDLRFVLAVLRINALLERMGDLARSVSKRIIGLAILPSVEMPSAMIEMSHAARKMVSDALSGLSNEDAALCRVVRQSDNRVDDLRKEVFAWGRAELPNHPEATQPILDILSMAQKIERIADLANNIAADVLFLIEGDVVRHTKV